MDLTSMQTPVSTPQPQVQANQTPNLLTYDMNPTKKSANQAPKQQAQALGNFTAEEAALFDLNSLTEEVNQKNQ